ncbi:hypothetical protein CEXT_56391 [Caerostris extrusa]|uniref:Uncharacterized protein n=1 Tax=Caerostris extrusa TaxID=172846 RepID=A0AAV4T592_CAEEX|nr:hypothetical protein CEXT_56391 [Caerostris extrusa]
MTRDRLDRREKEDFRFKRLQSTDKFPSNPKSLVDTPMLQIPWANLFDHLVKYSLASIVESFTKSSPIRKHK